MAASATTVSAPSGMVVASARPPRRAVPIRWRLDLSLGAAATFVTDPAFLGLSDRRSVLGAAPQITLDWKIGEVGYLFLGGGVAYRGTRREGYLQDTLATRLRVDEALFFGRLTLSPIEGVDTFLDLGVGPSVARVDVDSNSGATYTYGSQKNVLAVFDAAAGINLYLPKKWLPRKQAARITGGLTANLGYTFRNAPVIDPTLSQEDDAITTTTLPLGDVAMRGLSWRAGLFIRFM